MDRLNDKHKVAAAIAISSAFFLAELAVAYITGSLALMADAIHYLTDLLSFVVTLVSICVRFHMKSCRSFSARRAQGGVSGIRIDIKQVAEKTKFRQDFSYGWQRARILGAFFNGAFLLALGVGIMLNAIERFTELHHVDHVKMVLIMGCVGLGLNALTAIFLHDHHQHHNHHHHGHDHDHDDVGQHHHGTPEDLETGVAVEALQNPPTDAQTKGAATTTSTTTGDGDLTLNIDMCELHADHRHTTAAASIAAAARGRDLGMLGALLHVLGDALNNVGVIGAALAMWFGAPHNDGFFYADPAVSVVIAIMVMISAWPLLRRSGEILMQSAPGGVKLEDIRHDLERIPGVVKVHELHVWRLDQQKTIASAHLIVSDPDVAGFVARARVAARCLHAYGIHSVTLQPELAPLIVSPRPTSSSSASGARGSSQTGAGPHAAVAASSRVEGPVDNENNGNNNGEEDNMTNFTDGAQPTATTPPPMSTRSFHHGHSHGHDHHDQGQDDHHHDHSHGHISQPATECQIMCIGQECETLTCCGRPRDSNMERGD
ncbi:hypothetical protein VTJ49DRAFT_5886 [Mycothermus thermophilus]|uniref:Uncharacterized protein n=1 Tax=Humicola insolens TaxID=85995 RepID=A0ABR3VJY1_HUMIN